MFKVHKEINRILLGYTKISKHFMFKVHTKLGILANIDKENFKTFHV